MVDSAIAGAAGSAAGGAAVAGAGWALAKARELAAKHRAKELQMVGHEATIADLKEIRSSDEYERYERLVQDKELRRYIRMGLLLRKIHNDPDKLSRAKRALRMAGGDKAKAAAQCVQFGILSLLEREIDSGRGGGMTARDIEAFLHEADKFSYFVRQDAGEKAQAKEIELRIHANNPPFFVVSGSGAAASMTREIHHILKDGFPNHDEGAYSSKHEYILIYSRLGA